MMGTYKLSGEDRAESCPLVGLSMDCSTRSPGSIDMAARGRAVLGAGRDPDGERPSGGAESDVYGDLS